MPSIGSPIVDRQRGALNGFVALLALAVVMASTGAYYSTQDFSGWRSAYTRQQKPLDIAAPAGSDKFRRLALERSRHFVSAAGLGFVQPRDISALESHSGSAQVLPIRARSARYDIECLALNVYRGARRTVYWQDWRSACCLESHAGPPLPRFGLHGRQTRRLPGPT